MPPTTTRLTGSSGDGMLAMSALLARSGQGRRRLAEKADRTVTGLVAQASLRSHRRRGRASPGAPEPPTDPRQDSRRQSEVRVRKLGERPAPRILARPSLCGSRSPGAPGPHILTVAMEDRAVHLSLATGRDSGLQGAGDQGGIVVDSHRIAQ